ncbi:MAG: type II toxin-antitoxin system VapC family toxin [Candidatus Desantisbacteria bacterium]
MEAMEKNRICIDTDLIVEYLRGRKPLADKVELALIRYECCLTSITAYELYLGQERMKKKQNLDSLMEHFRILPFDLDSAKMVAKIQSELRKKGEEIGLPDTLIAGICMINKIPLLTNNYGHYSRITNLNLVVLDSLKMIE